MLSQFFSGNLKETDQLENLVADGRMLEYILKKQDIGREQQDIVKTVMNLRVP